MRLLVQQPDLVGELERVVRAHLGAEAVLERRDDPAAVRVVLRVRAGHQQQVQRQPHAVAADLDVPLLQHVEQRHLDALGQVGQLVDAEDAAVGARHEAVVDGLGVAQRAALGHLDRVDVADQVADAGVGRRQLLPEPVAAVQPADRGGVAVLGDLPVRPHRDRVQRVLVELAADEHRRPLVEQADQGADQAGLALAALAEQDEVVTGDERPLDLGEHGVLEADHAGQAGLAPAEPGQQVAAQLGLDRAEDGAAVAELAEGGGGGGRGALRGDVRHLDHGTTGLRRSVACPDGPAASPSTIGTASAAVSSRRTCAAVRERIRRSSPGQWRRGRGRRRAARRRRPAHPAVALPGLADRVGGPVWLKCENLQRTGSFKIRGAYTRISRLTDEERARGVVAASAGNHAQGVALAARLLGCSATVFMPVAAPLPKVAATRAYGAQIQLVGQTLTEALVAAAEYAERTGAVFIHPVRAPRRDRRAGHRRAGGARPVPRRRDGRRERRRRRAGRRGRGRDQGPRPDVSVVAVQAEAAAAFPGSLAAGRPVALEACRRWPTASPSPPRAT